MLAGGADRLDLRKQSSLFQSKSCICFCAAQERDDPMEKESNEEIQQSLQGQQAQQPTVRSFPCSITLCWNIWNRACIVSRLLEGVLLSGQDLLIELCIECAAGCTHQCQGDPASPECFHRSFSAASYS